jgi:hypothetical protein
MDGAVRVKPRPGKPKQDVEVWRASPRRPRIDIFYGVLGVSAIDSADGPG